MYTVTRQELKQARVTMALSQRELGERLGMTQTSVARMERGEQRIMFVTELAVRYLLLTEKLRKGKEKR
jgi:predicted transcriptional regulator